MELMLVIMLAFSGSFKAVYRSASLIFTIVIVLLSPAFSKLKFPIPGVPLPLVEAKSYVRRTGSFFNA